VHFEDTGVFSMGVKYAKELFDESLPSNCNESFDWTKLVGLDAVAEKSEVSEQVT